MRTRVNTRGTLKGPFVGARAHAHAISTAKPETGLTQSRTAFRRDEDRPWRTVQRSDQRALAAHAGPSEWERYPADARRGTACPRSRTVKSGRKRCRRFLWRWSRRITLPATKDQSREVRCHRRARRAGHVGELHRGRADEERGDRAPCRRRCCRSRCRRASRTDRCRASGPSAGVNTVVRKASVEAPHGASPGVESEGAMPIGTR